MRAKYDIIASAKVAKPSSEPPMIDRILVWVGAALIAMGFILYFVIGRVALSCPALEEEFSDDVTRATQLGN